MQRTRSNWIFVLLVAIFRLDRHGVTAFSAENDGGMTRRDLVKTTATAVVRLGYAKLVGDTLSRITRGIAYPKAHEQRVQHVIEQALWLAPTSNSAAPLRVLEVGIGKDCRVIRRGLYDTALQGLNRIGISRVELTGVDLNIPDPSAIQDATQHLSDVSQEMDVRFHAVEGDLTKALPFDDGSFDAIICSLTLCSVADQDVALQHLKRILKPKGTFGYVEHVAVDQDEPYRFLEWQQQVLDPLQQKLADNCHLHRHTEELIASVFGVDNGHAVRVERERFLVNNMWPVSCQCAGVIRRIK